MPKKVINIKQLPLHLQKAIRAEASNLNLKSKRKVVAATELSEEAKAFLDKAVRGTWTQRSDGKIDVDGSMIFIKNAKLDSFLGKEIFFGEVTRDFMCNDTYISSLKGAPEKVGGYFDCYSTYLTSLEGAPKEVGHIYCGDNNLTSLEGAPEKVRGDFYCTMTSITSLKGAPREVGGDFSCSVTEITSLEGAPEKVGGNFDCSSTKISSLKGAPRVVGRSFYCSDTKITSLQGAPEKVGGDFDCTTTPFLTSLEGIGEVRGRIYSDLE